MKGLGERGGGGEESSLLPHSPNHDHDADLKKEDLLEELNLLEDRYGDVDNGSHEKGPGGVLQ